MRIEELIPEGKGNVISRHDLIQRFIAFGAIEENSVCTERIFMHVLHEIRKNTVVISTGRGYFRPTPADKEELTTYIKKEEHRIKETNDNIKYAKKYLADIEAGRL